MPAGPSIHDLHLPNAPTVEDVPGPKSRRLVERQLEREPLTTSYPRTLPLTIDEAKGATIRDVDGNVFLDFSSGIGQMNVGYSNPYVLEGVHDQIDRCVQSVDFPTEVRLEFLDALRAISPGSLEQDSLIALGGPTGANAIEATIKLARGYSGGTELLAFRGSYHGGSLGALSLSSTSDYRDPFAPLLANATFFPFPAKDAGNGSEEAAAEDALGTLRKALEDPHGGVTDPAGVWVEPIQGTGGVVIPPDGFLEGLQEICETHDIPLVFDEIQTGFGRTGRWFGAEWTDATPSMMTTAKSLGGVGFPISATLYDESLDCLEPGLHGGTFRGHAAAMRAGIRAMDYIREHDLLAHTREIGSLIRSRLREATDGNSYVGDIRGRGLLIGIEFVTPEGDPAPDVKAAVRTQCFERGLLVWTGGNHGQVIRLLPPLVLTRELAERGASILASAIRQVTTGR